MPTMTEHDAAAPANLTEDADTDSLAPWQPDLEPLVAPAVPLGPLRPRGQRQRWLVHGIKTALLVIEIPVLLVLAMSAGLLQVLPPTPPAADLAANGHSARTGPVSYCWFTPGHGTCAQPPNQRTASLTAARASTVTLRIGSPAPTTCSSTATRSGSGTGYTLPMRPASGAHGAYTFLAPAALDTYTLDVHCQWMSNPALRWLQGLGDADYTFVLHVDH